jgi:AraC-like DNA-binding protein
MVAAAVEPSLDRVACAKKQIDLGRLERLRQTVQKHLHTPSLGHAMLCRAVGMSRSSLYRLLEDVGGVERYIRSQRLLKAHATLARPTSRLSISAVAEGLCFADLSAFSRAFRREFGYSPSAVRAFAEARAIRSPAAGSSTDVDIDFSDLLRGF